MCMRVASQDLTWRHITDGTPPSLISAEGSFEKDSGEFSRLIGVMTQVHRLHYIVQSILDNSEILVIYGYGGGHSAPSQ